MNSLFEIISIVSIRFVIKLRSRIVVQWDPNRTVRHPVQGQWMLWLCGNAISASTLVQQWQHVNKMCTIEKREQECKVTCKRTLCRLLYTIQSTSRILCTHNNHAGYEMVKIFYYRVILTEFRYLILFSESRVFQNRTTTTNLKNIKLIKENACTIKSHPVHTTAIPSSSPSSSTGVVSTDNKLPRKGRRRCWSCQYGGSAEGCCVVCWFVGLGRKKEGCAK